MQSRNKAKVLRTSSTLDMVRRVFGLQRFAGFAIALTLLTAGADLTGQQRDGEGFRFRSGVVLVNVSATVSDRSGRFVPGLHKEDFRLFEDGQPQEITHFSSERVPVSLGIALDTSGSMAGEKWRSAKDAVNRFLELLDAGDEVFLYGFSSEPELLQDWTTDHALISRALNRRGPNGGTALYDAAAEAVPLAQTGRNQKKAVIIISDGNDTNSGIALSELRGLIRETEVLVYAIGIDGREEPTFGTGRQRPPPRVPIPFPFPIPGRRRPFRDQLPWPPIVGPGGGAQRRTGDGVDTAALRAITDDSGGRTEVVRTARDLEPATASIADELSRQYYIGYPGAGNGDGRWHAIKVETRDARFRVRVRRGYIATP